MVLALYWLVPPTADWLEMSLHVRVAWLSAAVAGGAGVYALALFVAGIRPSTLARPRSNQ